jgi:hypothetical protein
MPIAPAIVVAATVIAISIAIVSIFPALMLTPLFALVPLVPRSLSPLVTIAVPVVPVIIPIARGRHLGLRKSQYRSKNQSGNRQRSEHVCLLLIGRSTRSGTIQS